jgi:hypothetical protein
MGNLKGPLATVLERLSYALVFLASAKTESFAEVRTQHLEEAERLIEQAKSVLENWNGQTA